MIRMIADGSQGEEFQALWEEMREESSQIMFQAAEQEKEWADYLFQDGPIIGLNKAILSELVEYFANQRAIAVGLYAYYPPQKKNPIGWFSSWITSSGVQVAPQETEISSYQIGQIDNDYDDDDLDMEL